MMNEWAPMGSSGHYAHEVCLCLGMNPLIKLYAVIFSYGQRPEAN